MTKKAKSAVTFTYKTTPVRNLEADLWSPEEIKGDAPVVITVHGGSWSSRDRSDMNKIAKELVKHGYIVINMEYELVPESLFPAQIDDVRAVVSWIIDNREKYHLDVKRINFWGYSAGSQISTLAALQLNDIIKVRSIINGAGPMDLYASRDSKQVIAYIGGDDEKKLKAASPINFITPQSPPVFTYQSTNDHIVEFAHAERLNAVLEKNHVEHETYKVPVLGHIMTFLFSDKSIEKAINFLDRHNK